MADLFSSFKLKNKEIHNRLVYPPVVRFGLSKGDGFVTEENIESYKYMSSGEAGIVIVEATCISLNGRLRKNQLGIWGDEFIPGLSKIADAIHEKGSLALIQIHHAGIKTDKNSAAIENIFTASPFEDKDGVVIREASEAELEKVVEDFVNASKRAKAAGFDGVEIHGAHGYLISQFLSHNINKREDEYGKDKALLGKKVIKAVKENMDSDFIVGMRLGANEPDLKGGIEYAKTFEKAGVDYLHISSNFSTKEPEDMEIIDDEFSWIANLGFNIKKHVNIPVICVFGIDKPEMADEVIKKGYADFAASAKGLLCDPMWLSKYKTGDKINPCLKCRVCSFYSEDKPCPARKKAGIVTP
jgi:2,4-dienoyl-CoA reductase-like NADH-dependent reductase (Old Yellow Enzyme family)